jgi:Na+-transporting methylmalonyl-CoA/oxaloacetate decarboxylase gamma subunit
MRDYLEMIGELFAMLLVICFVLIVLLLIAFAINAGFEASKSPEQKETERKQEIYNATPHKYAEVDGCTVYTWFNGYNHYFTKCENKVITEGHHTERHGKISEDVKEIIETENKNGK